MKKKISKEKLIKYKNSWRGYFDWSIGLPGQALLWLSGRNEEEQYKLKF